MATDMGKVYMAQMQDLQQNQEFNLKDIAGMESFVKNATWRDILLNLVETNKLNVWDIDISKIVESYLNFIKQLKILDLYIPANIILAASILLRLKSKTISFENDYNQEIEQDNNQTNERIIPEVDAIYPRLRLQPNKKISLDELLEALNDAMRIEKQHKENNEKPVQQLNLKIDIEIDKKIDKVYNLISIHTDSQKMTTFEILKTNFNENILLNLFIPLLFLMHKNKIILIQDIFFGEILIKLTN